MHIFSAFQTKGGLTTLRYTLCLRVLNYTLRTEWSEAAGSIAQRSGEAFTLQAERSGAIYQSLRRTFKRIPAAGRCKK